MQHKTELLNKFRNYYINLAPITPISPVTTNGNSDKGVSNGIDGVDRDIDKVDKVGHGVDLLYVAPMER